MSDAATYYVVEMHSAGEPVRFDVEHMRGRVKPGQRCLIAGATGLPFSGEIVGTGRLGRYDTITTRVGGRAPYSGEAAFRVEADDPLAGGFLVDRFRKPA